MKTIQQRLFDRREITQTGCWEWMGYRARYGVIKYGSVKKVHRVAWEIFVGPIPNGLNVLHKCDNPPCFNPDHLFLGTQADNVRDCCRKGRNFVPVCPSEKRARGDQNGMRKYPELMRGSRNPNAKLNDEQRQEIATRRIAGALRQDLAKEFGVHESQIRRICNALGVGCVYPSSWTAIQRAKNMSSRKLKL